ncbi:MAG TPA: cytochrome c3 family protein, partial [Pirellulales bacterium]|nr:cytochrome c3 family protein [Pirellulales bacterium]
MNTESASSSDSTAFLPLAPAVKPPPPNDDYVGSDACANCHREIYDSYVKHPMYYSAGLVPGEHEVEAFDERAEFQPPGNRRYGVELTADQVIHHETMLDSQGQAIYDDAAVARIFIGSGTRGKSYGILRGDRLFESMISWYTSHGGSWGLSPGYLPATHQRFERPIADECMTCHAGRMVVGAAEDTFREPLFHEAAIGCERCHGPGQAHVARHEAGDGGEGGSGEGGNADDIVNPANLDPARRESICNQCHIPGKFSLPRYGRTAYDFRPGQLLDDAVTIMVEGTGVRDDGTTKSVSQVQQMRASACFLQSAGAFGCSSCHDPHSKPEPAAAEEFYRGRCLKCHEQRGCSLPEAERLRPPAADSCTHCHMPRISANDVAHTSQTDHRVVRRLQADVGGTARGSGTGSGSSTGHASSGGEWELFDHAERRLERWEVERVQGLAL